MSIFDDLSPEDRERALAAFDRVLAEQERRRAKFADLPAWLANRFDLSALRDSFRDMHIETRWTNAGDDILVRLDWDESTTDRIEEIDRGLVRVIRGERRRMQLNVVVSARLLTEGDEYEPVRMLVTALGSKLDAHRGSRSGTHARRIRIVRDEPT